MFILNFICSLHYNCLSTSKVTYDTQLTVVMYSTLCHFFFRNGIRQGRIYLDGGEVTECSDMYKEVCPTHLWNSLVLETKRGNYGRVLSHDYQ